MDARKRNVKIREYYKDKEIRKNIEKWKECVKKEKRLEIVKRKNEGELNIKNFEGCKKIWKNL